MSRASISISPRRQVWVILAIVFFGYLGISMPYLIFPSIFLNPAYSIVPEGWGTASSSLLLGITLGAYPLGQFFGSPILGALSDDYGRKKLLSGSLFIAGVCNILTAISLIVGSLWLLILTRFIGGLMEGNLSIARSMAADIKEISKTETFGKINGSASIAFLVGPLLGGLLSDPDLSPYFTTATPFFVMSILYFGLSAVSFFGTMERRKTTSAVKRNVMERLNFIKRLAVLFRNKRLRFLLIVVSLFTLAVDIFYEFGPVFLTAKWMLNPSQLAVYNASLCVTLALGSSWLPSFLSNRYDDHKIVSLSIAVFILALAAITAVDMHGVMLLLFAIIGFGIAVAVTILTVHISDSASEEIQGEVMGVQMSLRVLGDAIICLIGGILLLFSAKIILLAATGLSIATLSYYIKNPLARVSAASEQG